MTKSEKDDVNYSPGHLTSHCGPTFHDDKYYCRHFRPSVSVETGACDLVKGQIEKTYWCELYQRTKAKA